MPILKKVRKKPLFKAVGVEAANSDDGRPAAAGDVSLSGGELCSKNYGQQIRRKRKRHSNSGSSISRTPRATGARVTPSQLELERFQGVTEEGTLPGGTEEGTLPSGTEEVTLPSGTEEVTLPGVTEEVVTELSCGKKTKIDDSPCVDQRSDTPTHRTSFELAASPEHNRHSRESEGRSETGAYNVNSLMEVGSFSAHQVRTSEHFYTDAPPQCDRSPEVVDVDHTEPHQQTSPAGPHSVTLVENSFDDMEETACGRYATSTVSSVPIPDQQAGMVLGQTHDNVPHQCSTGTGAHSEREDGCEVIESHKDELLDELFGLPKADSSLRNNDMAEDLLCGLCPEDLSFTLNVSVCQDFAKEDGFTSPRYSLVKSPDASETPSRCKKPRTWISTPQCTAAICGEDGSVGGGAATVPVSELSSRASDLKEEAVVPQGVKRDGVSQDKGGGGGGETRGVGDGGRTEGEGGVGGSRGGERRGGGGGGEQGGGRGGEVGTLHCYPADTFYGLPHKVQSCLEENRGIKKLYDWQDTCLRLPSVASSHNLIYSLPTSGGKTLVAEILILRQLLLGGKDVLFVLPFVSIVQEKVRELLPFASALGFAVEEYAASKGKIPPRKRRKKNVVYIATIEKANGLINSLIELQRIGTVGLVVVDELHMLGDGGVRGATLEACLAKILYCAADTQIVGMSATLNNLQELATFLRASVYSNDFRPVELCEYVKVERCVYSVKVERGNVNFHPERDVQDFNAQMDRDQLCSLVMEVVPDSSCLLFCPTKKSCQNVATLLATCLPRFLREVKQQARYNLLKLLSIEAAGVCPILAQTIPYGVAYHHSGLTADERRIIEEAYLEGTLCLLACTSTLAAGVNLPAKRVIIRSPYVGNQFLTRSQYKQIIGRAGRAGLCRTGESILLLQHRDKEKVVDLLSGPYDQCSSSLLTGGAPALLSLILTLIGLKLVGSTRDLHLFFQSTLLQVQHDPGHLSLSCQETVSKLVAMGYITMETGSNPDVSTFKITSLGRATYKGCLPVEQAHIVYHNLVKAQQCLALSTDLHLLHLCTPPDLTSTITPNWMAYFETVTRLCPDDLQVAELVGISPGFLTKKATGTAGRMSDSSLSLYHQFYITLMLHSLLRASSPRAVWAVAEYFHCSRGFLQNIINSTAAFASCLVHFTEELPELWALHLLLPAIGKRLAFSASIELVPLMEIPGVKQGRAMQLLAAGYRTPQDIAAADPTTLSEQIEHMFPKNAKKLIHAAKVLLVDQAEALFEEAEELMSLAPQNSS